MAQVKINKIFRSKIYIALILVFLVLAIGVLGFHYLSDYTWLDAVYMTVITIATVGFEEVNPLDDNAKIFTIVLILISLLILGYAMSVITEFIVSKNNIDEIKHRKMQKAIDQLKNHIIICGYGRNGRQTVKKLRSYDMDFLVIEKNSSLLASLKEDNVSYIVGDATEDKILSKAGIETAKTLITALSNDSDNLFVVLSARQLNQKLRIISRASKESSYQKLKFAGADNVVLPNIIGGDHMASLVVIPDLVEFIDNLSIIGKNTINIKELHVDELRDYSESKTIAELNIRKHSGCTVIGYKNEKGEYIVNPEAYMPLESNSQLIVIGRPQQIQKLITHYNITEEKV